MNISEVEYSKLVDEVLPKSKVFKNSMIAFIVGGTICLMGELLTQFYQMIGLELLTARNVVCVTLIFISAFLTSIHVYDDIAKIAGAGTLVPITGFANAVVSPAIEFKSEGQILGMSAKIFTISGPVIIFGVLSSVMYGLIYFFLNCFGGGM